jgi:hypothetical protein
MDKFSGARHSAYTMRRFYPAMYGRNLTFMPSQYGYGAEEKKEDEKKSEPKTQREKSTTELLFEAGTIFGLREYERRTSEKAADAEVAREGLRQKYSSEAEARKISAQALADQMGRKPANPIPWLIGGLAIVVGGGLLYLNMSQKKA